MLIVIDSRIVTKRLLFYISLGLCKVLLYRQDLFICLKKIIYINYYDILGLEKCVLLFRFYSWALKNIITVQNYFTMLEYIVLEINILRKCQVEKSTASKSRWFTISMQTHFTSYIDIYRTDTHSSPFSLFNFPFFGNMSLSKTGCRKCQSQRGFRIPLTQFPISAKF